MAVQIRKSNSATHAWGIILGLTGLPVVALFLKIFPDLRIAWNVLFVAFGLLALKSLVSYLMPRRNNEPGDHGHAH
jgi:hypothetical protein